MSPSGFLGACKLKNRPRESVGVAFTFLCANVDGAFAESTARGVVFEKPPSLHGKPPTVLSAFSRDPDGYLLELQEFRASRWPFPKTRQRTAAQQTRGG